MKIIYGINKVTEFKKAVVALGVFDGLHLGHRDILQFAVIKAAKIKGTSIVLTFLPHPQGKKSLYSLEHRLKLIAELGVDVCIVVNFSDSFAKITPEDFIRKILVKKIGVCFVCIGKNFHFGNKAAGDYRLLKKYGKNYNFRVKAFNVIKSKGTVVSSTFIRKLIRSSKIRQAQDLLGRPVSILGTVIKGSRLARVLGFPTANINPHHEIIPLAGIYAVQIKFCGKTYKGICYIGRRPTINVWNRSVHIEVHIFDFSKNIYKKPLEILFIKLIRLDKKFACVKDLTLQVQKDIISCRKILTLHSQHHHR